MSKYVFKPSSKLFARLFAAEKKRLLAGISLALQIEHIGSTSIPRLGGKGIIDIAISAPKEHLEEVSLQLQSLGYEFRKTFSTADRLYFIQ